MSGPPTQRRPLGLPHRAVTAPERRVSQVDAAGGLAGSVCLQRVSSDGHWPSDVLVAMAVGTAIAREVIELGEGRRMTIAPAVGPGGAPALAVSVAF